MSRKAAEGELDAGVVNRRVWVIRSGAPSRDRTVLTAPLLDPATVIS